MIVSQKLQVYILVYPHSSETIPWCSRLIDIPPLHI